MKVRQAGRERKLGLPVIGESGMNAAQAAYALQSRKATGNPASKALVGTLPGPEILAGKPGAVKAARRVWGGGKTVRSYLSLRATSMETMRTHRSSEKDRRGVLGQERKPRPCDVQVSLPERAQARAAVRSLRDNALHAASLRRRWAREEPDGGMRVKS